MKNKDRIELNEITLQEIPHISYKKVCGIKEYIKRMSLFFLQNKSGSMTVEAAIAIPLFLFFIVNILSLILIFGEYTSNLSQLHQRAKQLAIMSHLSDSNTSTDNDMVIMTKIQTIDPVMPIIKFTTARTIVNCRVRKWTGYQNEMVASDKEEEEWVYITQTGEVYHRSRDCSHLNVSIQCCNWENIKFLRNMNGEKYRPCEKCGTNGGLGILYITNQGNRYHSDIQCSGLKRTVKVVPISKVGQRRPCSKCG